MTDKEWITVEEAAARCGVHPQTIYRWTWDKKLKSKKVPPYYRWVRIWAKDVDKVAKAAQVP